MITRIMLWWIHGRLDYWLDKQFGLMYKEWDNDVWARITSKVDKYYALKLKWENRL